MKRAAAFLMMGLSLVLGGCVHYIKLKPGSPPPRISLNPAGEHEKQFLPKLNHYFERAGYKVVHGGPADYELDFNVVEQPLGVEVKMNLFQGGQLHSSGEGHAVGRIHDANRASVADEAINSALDDLEPPTVVYR